MPTFSGLLALAVGSGINLYATNLTVGLSIRFGWLTNLPNDLRILAHPPAFWRSPSQTPGFKLGLAVKKA